MTKNIAGQVFPKKDKSTKELKDKLKRQELQLKALEKKVSSLNQLHDDFLTVISHELKTPMTSVLGYLWMVLNGKAGKLSKTAKGHLQKAYGSAVREVKLVDDMLDVSRIDRGTIQITPKPVSIIPLVKEVINESRTQAKGDGLKFVITRPEEELPDVIADPHRLKQILVNLIDNAIKYTEKGSITVSFIENNGYIETAVADTGKGITKENLSKLFKKFGRIGNSFVSMAETAGTGLGLYLTKQLVELQKGKIWVGSKPGKGSTFTFSLPVAMKSK